MVHVYVIARSKVQWCQSHGLLDTADDTGSTRMQGPVEVACIDFIGTAQFWYGSDQVSEH